MKENRYFDGTIAVGRHIMCSDLDQPAVMDLNVGFTYYGKLAITIDYDDCNHGDAMFSLSAIVDTDTARAMARRNGVKFNDLPDFIADCMSDWGEVVNPDFRCVTACFKEITECLLDEGCRFRIARTPGAGRHIG